MLDQVNKSLGLDVASSLLVRADRDLGQKRTFREVETMSALPPKADIA